VSSRKCRHRQGDSLCSTRGIIQIEDGPDEEGNYFTRPGKPLDLVPSAFPNVEAAKMQFFGLYPPDLTYIIVARRNGRNLLFSLLTGWMDPPAGVSLTEDQHFNIYYPGGVTVMSQVTKSPCTLPQNYLLFGKRRLLSSSPLLLISRHVESFDPDTVRWNDRLRRRDPVDGVANGQGCRGISQLDILARARSTKTKVHQGDRDLGDSPAIRSLLPKISLVASQKQTHRVHTQGEGSRNAQPVDYSWFGKDAQRMKKRMIAFVASIAYYRDLDDAR
jgi:hypothetical protein